VAIYVVEITYDDREIRDRVRPSHREFLQQQLVRGALVSGGPIVDDSGALLVYEADSAEAVQAILDQDPYSRNPGCLASITIREWNRVFNRS
jgi:uncharacterized protein YciI